MSDGGVPGRSGVEQYEFDEESWLARRIADLAWEQEMDQEDIIRQCCYHGVMNYEKALGIEA